MIVVATILLDTRPAVFSDPVGLDSTIVGGEFGAGDRSVGEVAVDVRGRRNSVLHALVLDGLAHPSAGLLIVLVGGTGGFGVGIAILVDSRRGVPGGSFMSSDGVASVQVMLVWLSSGDSSESRQNDDHKSVDLHIG